MGAGCKPAGFCLRWFESNTLHQVVRRAQRRMPITRSERMVRGSARPRASSCVSTLRYPGTGPSGNVRLGKAAAPIFAGVAQLVERQPSKLNVASSNLVSRSLFISRGRPNPRGFAFISRGRPNPRGFAFLVRGCTSPRMVRFSSGPSRPRSSAHLAQLVEHVLGKDEVISSILMVGSQSGCGVTRPQSECGVTRRS
jgi:hypothetical protein